MPIMQQYIGTEKPIGGLCENRQCTRGRSSVVCQP